MRKILYDISIIHVLTALYCGRLKIGIYLESFFYSVHWEALIRRNFCIWIDNTPNEDLVSA